MIKIKKKLNQIHKKSMREFRRVEMNSSTSATRKNFLKDDKLKILVRTSPVAYQVQSFELSLCGLKIEDFDFHLSFWCVFLIVFFL